MDYRIQDVEDAFEGRITGRPGGGEYVITINGDEHALRIIGMDSRGMEFVLDREYHMARYLKHSTNEMSMVVDNVPITVNMHGHFDDIVYKNSGGGGPASEHLALKSQIPGKVVSVAVSEGDSVRKGDVVCTLESMKMQVAVKSHKDGSVKSVKIKEGVSIAKGDVVAEIE